MSYTRFQYIDDKESKGWQFFFDETCYNDEDGTTSYSYIVTRPNGVKTGVSVTGDKHNIDITLDRLFKELIRECHE